MNPITLDTITEAAAGTFDGLSDARARQLLRALVRHLHSFAREVMLTHEEWRRALAFMHRVGDISNDERSEFSLLSDVTGLSSVVDLMASAPGTTPGSVLGPFHAVGSPWLENPVNLFGANAGPRVLLRGRVCDVDGKALAEATIDFWQNAANGKYWQMDASQPRDNLRCQLRLDAEGCFEIATIRPVPYTIPMDGPVWHDLMRPANRNPWRPAHFHIIVSAPGYRTLVTEIFEESDPYLDTDAVFGVRDALVGRYERMTDAVACARHGLEGSECDVMQIELQLASAD